MIKLHKTVKTTISGLWDIWNWKAFIQEKLMNLEEEQWEWHFSHMGVILIYHYLLVPSILGLDRAWNTATLQLQDLTWFGVKCEKAPCPEALSKTIVNLVADNQGRSTSQLPVVVILSMTLLDQKNTGVISTYPPSLLIPNWSCLPFPLPSFLITSTPHALSH